MNNNRLSLILSSVALIAVIVLYVLFFSLKDKKQNATIAPNGLTIAYVNIDSVLDQYILYNKLSLEIDGKQKNLEKELQGKMLSLQNKVNKLQNQYEQRLITTQTYQEQLANLQREQETIEKWRQEKALELNDDLLKLQKRIYDSILNVIKTINKENKYSIIMANSTTGPILDADKTLDLTKEVIKILNDKVELK